MESNKAIVPILLLIIAGAVLRAVSWSGSLAPTGRALSGLMMIAALILIGLFGRGKLKL